MSVGVWQSDSEHRGEFYVDRTVSVNVRPRVFVYLGCKQHLII